MRTGKNAVIAPAFGQPADQLVILASGADGGDGVPAVVAGRDSLIVSLLAAPHGTISFENGARARGAFAAFDVIVGDGVEVAFQSGFPDSSAGQPGSQKLSGYYGAPPNPAVAALAAPVAPDTTLHLSIGLPNSQCDGLADLRQSGFRPDQQNYRRYLTLPRFTTQYGATPSDYQAVVAWAGAHGLTVTATYPNNLLLDVSGTATQVEQALFVNLVYRLRQDGSRFVAVDREPSLDLGVPILHISGLAEFVLPKPQPSTVREPAIAIRDGISATPIWAPGRHAPRSPAPGRSSVCSSSTDSNKAISTPT